MEQASAHGCEQFQFRFRMPQGSEMSSGLPAPRWEGLFGSRLSSLPEACLQVLSPLSSLVRTLFGLYISCQARERCGLHSSFAEMSVFRIHRKTKFGFEACKATSSLGCSSLQRQCTLLYMFVDSLVSLVSLFRDRFRMQDEVRDSTY